MTRLTAILVLLASATLLFAQQPWQGEVKQLYKIDVPSYDGVRPVYGMVKKGGNLAADVEMYSLSLKLAALKPPADFFRAYLEKQGFKSANNTSTATLERVEMVNAERKLTAVVVASKQTAQTMLIGITVMPEGTIAKANAPTAKK